MHLLHCYYTLASSDHLYPFSRHLQTGNGFLHCLNLFHCADDFLLILCKFLVELQQPELERPSRARNKATHGWLYLAALVNLNFCLNSYTLLRSPFFLVGEASQPKRMTADRVQLWQVPACCRCCSFLELRHASTEQPSSRQSKIAVMQPSSHSKTGGGGGGACQVIVNPCHVLSCSCALPSVLSCFIVLPCTGSNVVNSPLVMASATVSRQSSPQESVDIGLLFLLGFGQ